MTTPVSAATPASARKPTATAIERLNSSSHRAQTPPISANGKDSITIAISVTLPKVRYSRRTITASVSGTTTCVSGLAYPPGYQVVPNTV